jgi:energy-coupling factor transport system permease/ATP-binding protein
MRIKAQNISYQTNDEEKAILVKPLDLTLEPGTVTLLVGRTGSGKSTLLHMLAGIKAPLPDGQILCGDVSLWKREKAERTLLNRIGFVYQYPEHQFFLPTVREELIYSLRPYRMDPARRNNRIAEAAHTCGLQEELMDRSPFFLSGGEKRKAALASVIAADPDWLLLDEPSSGLDSSMSGWLSEQLVLMKKARSERGGLVIATHDLDLFLPIADRVLIMMEGEALGCWSPDELVRMPNILDEAGIGIPDCIKLAAFLPARREGKQSLHAAELAGLWADALQNNTQKPRQEVIVVQTGNDAEAVNSYGDATVQETPNPPAPVRSMESSGKKTGNPLEERDPRAKWFVYLCFTFGILAQPGWLVTLIGMLMVSLLAGFAGISAARWGKPLLPMVFFLLLSFGISGLELSLSWEPFSLGGTRFAWEPAVGTLRHLVPLLPLIAGGILFAATTSPMSMKKGLEAPLKAIPGLNKWAEAIALGTSVLFRFLKWIPAEIDRFSMLSSIRGKKGGRPGRLRIRELPSFFTPLLLSLMLQAEELSVALEARGYGAANVQRTNAAPLRWKRTDGTACWAGAVTGCMLAAIGWLAG